MSPNSEENLEKHQAELEIIFAFHWTEKLFIWIVAGPLPCAAWPHLGGQVLALVLTHGPGRLRILPACGEDVACPWREMTSSP